MKQSLLRSLISMVVLALPTAALAGISVTTFEDTSLPTDSFKNGSDYSAGFHDNGNFFNNSYVDYSPFGYTWSGWAISNTTTQVPIDYNNQYRSVTGSGANGSATYAVAFTFGDSDDPLHPSGSYINLAPGASPVSFDVTNTTYDYLVMKFGNLYAKAFTDSSYFELTITGYTEFGGMGAKVGDEIDVSLANGKDILTTWKTVDLAGLAGTTSLVFGLRSSDNDPVYGINTPSYFAFDNLTLSTPSAVPEPGSVLLCLVGIGIGGFAALRRTRRRAD